MSASEACAPIVVAGAGVGGLAAALSLAQAGQGVALYERAPQISEVGAGLQIAPNAGRILQNLGLGPALDRFALEPKAINIRRGADGAVLARLPLDGARDRWGAPFRVFHRADLQSLLLEAAQNSDKISIRTGARIGDFEEEAGAVHIRLHAGSVAEDIEARALIGADGLRSAVRATLFRDTKDAPAYCGHTAWRAILPAAAVPPASLARETNLWLGPRAHVVHYPLRDATIVSAVVIVESPQEGPQTLAGAELAREIGWSRWSEDLRALIDAAPEWRRWPLFIRPPLKGWSRGAVTLLGDAAHPMVPFLAQGAAQAIEDAAALGSAFSSGASPAAAIALYQKARIARAVRVQRGSRRQGAYFHFRGPLAAARDLAIRTLGGAGMLERNAWLYR